jgi:Flp pilus assembly protein TadB
MVMVVVALVAVRTVRPLDAEVGGWVRPGAAVFAIGCFVGGLLWPPAVVVVVLGSGGVFVSGVVRRRSRQRRHRRAVVAEVPQIVDLLVLATSAGLLLPQAIDAVAPCATGPVGRSLVAARSGSRGELARSVADALGVHGDPVRPLSALLVANVRYGTPLVEPLERVGDAARRAHRRQVELDARRLPVQMLLPLVACGLPAFVLVAIVPVALSIAGGLG